MTYEEISKVPDAIHYWIFRGGFNLKGGAFAPVVWADKDLGSPTGFIPARMETPGKIRSGFPETFGGAPERADVELTLIDFDNYFTDFFTGGSLPSDEGLGASFYNLTGKLYIGVKHPTDNTAGGMAEIEVTPTLVMGGSPIRSESKITLPMASRDEIFASQIPRVLVSDIADSVLDGNATFAYVSNTLSDTSAVHAERTMPLGDFSALKAEFTENLDSEIPFPYGRFLSKPILVTPKETNKPKWILGCFVNTPGNWTIGAFGYYWDEIHNTVSEPLYFVKARVYVQKLDRYFWVVILTTGPKDLSGLSLDVGERPANGETISALKDNKKLVVVMGNGSRAGFKHSVHHPAVASPPWTSSDASLEGWANPVALLYQIIRDFGPNATFDIAAWRFAADTMQGVFGIGGVLSAGQTLLDVIESVTTPFGIQLTILTDDSISVSVYEKIDDSAKTAASNMTFREGSSIVTNFEESIPVDAAADGAIASRLEIAWSSDVKEVFTGRIPMLVPGFDRTPMVAEAKTTVPGEFILPDSSSVLLRGVMQSRKFGYRRFRFGCEPIDAIKNLGKLVRVATSEGAKAPRGYANRLAKVIRYEIEPSSGYTEVTCKDLGPLEDLNWGLFLDTETKWISYLPNVGDKITIDNEKVTFDNGNFDVNEVKGSGKCSLWISGISYTIVKVTDSKNFEISPKVTPKRTITSDGKTTGCHKMLWVIMRAHAHDNVQSRVGFIRLASNLNERFTDGSEGYRFRGI